MAEQSFSITQDPVNKASLTISLNNKAFHMGKAFHAYKAFHADKAAGDASVINSSVSSDGALTADVKYGSINYHCTGSFKEEGETKLTDFNCTSGATSCAFSAGEMEAMGVAGSDPSEQSSQPSAGTEGGAGIEEIKCTADMPSCYTGKGCNEGLVYNGTNGLCEKPATPPEKGAEGGACMDGGTCNPDLTCSSNVCIKMTPLTCSDGAACPAGTTCKDGACVNIPVQGTKVFGDVCSATSECGANLTCTDSKCAWSPDFVIPFADANLKQAVIDAIKTTDPAYSATDVKVADCEKLPKMELITLDVSDRGITDIAGIQYCSILQELNLSNNQLTNLPAGIFTGLTNLQKLYLGGNQLTNLPAGIFTGLTNLQILSLYNNQLTNLPAGIFTGLTNLQKLYLYKNQLTTLPAGIFTGLTNLQKLSLDNNQLTNLPAGIFTGLTNLQELYLGGNQLTNLPAGIFTGLTNLQILSLYKNQLTTLPAGIFTDLTSLKKLYLHGNQLTTLPADIFTGLTNLQELVLSYNKISDISALSGLTKLTFLNLLNNSIAYLQPLLTLHKGGGLQKGSTLKINNVSLVGVINAQILNTLKKDGVNVMTSE